MADFPNIVPDDEVIGLAANNQIFDSVLTGETQTAQLTGDKWNAQPSFSNRVGDEARELRAFIFSLGGVSGTFNYSPFSIDQGGTMSGAGVVDGAGQTGSVLNTKGWDGLQPELFKIGDYLSFNGELKMVTGDVDYSDVVSYPDAANFMPFPFDPEGWTSSANSNLTNIAQENPSGTSVTGLVNTTSLLGNAIFNTSQNESVIRGERTYLSMIFKDITDNYKIIFQTKMDGSVFNASINPAGTVDSVNVNLEYKITALSDGYFLVETAYESPYESLDIDKFVFINNQQAGTQLYVQSAFSGKNPLEYPYAQYNEFEDAAEVGEWNGGDVNLSASGGLLSFVATGGDPQMKKNVVHFDGGKYNSIKIKWRRNAGITTNVFFWGNSNGGPALDRQVAFSESINTGESQTTGPDGSGFYTTMLNLSADPEWNGTGGGDITEIRIDFGNSLTSDFDIDYIKIYSPSLLTAYEEWWPALVEGTASIPIAPPIRVSPADNNAIEVTKPYFVGRLEDDDQAQVSVSAPIIYNSTLSIVEAF